MSLPEVAPAAGWAKRKGLNFIARWIQVTSNQCLLSAAKWAANCGHKGAPTASCSTRFWDHHRSSAPGSSTNTQACCGFALWGRRFPYNHFYLHLIGRSSKTATLISTSFTIKNSQHGKINHFCRKNMHPNVIKHFQLKSTLNYACENSEFILLKRSKMLLISWPIYAA